MFCHEQSVYSLWVWCVFSLLVRCSSRNNTLGADNLGLDTSVPIKTCCQLRHCRPLYFRENNASLIGMLMQQQQTLSERDNTPWKLIALLKRELFWINKATWLSGRSACVCEQSEEGFIFPAVCVRAGCESVSRSVSGDVWDPPPGWLRRWR